MSAQEASSTIWIVLIVLVILSLVYIGCKLHEAKQIVDAVCKKKTDEE